MSNRGNQAVKHKLVHNTDKESLREANEHVSNLRFCRATKENTFIYPCPTQRKKSNLENKNSWKEKRCAYQWQKHRRVKRKFKRKSVSSINPEALLDELEALDVLEDDFSDCDYDVYWQSA